MLAFEYFYWFRCAENSFRIVKIVQLISLCVLNGSFRGTKQPALLHHVRGSFLPDRSVTKIPDFFAQQPQDLQLAAQAAFAAGQIIKDGYERSHQIDAKGVGDLVSQVDFDADRVATDLLSEAYPDTTIISEELNPGSR